MVSDEDILKRLDTILQGADLETTTERQIRKQLEQEFGCDLKDRKGLIRSAVVRYLEASQPVEEEEEGEEEEEEEEKPKKKGGMQALCLLSPALAEFVGAEKMSRMQVVKKVWEYIKANDLQNPKDRRKIIIDEKLGKFFKSPLTMFSMNKQLVDHVFKAEDVAGYQSSGDDDEEEAKPKKKKAPAKKRSRAKDNSDDNGEAKPKKKATGGFTMKLKVSDKLAKFTGQAEMSRADLTKYFWNYFKENGLQVPENKQFIQPDAALQDLFGISKPFQGFSIQKMLGPHILK